MVKKVIKNKDENKSNSKVHVSMKTGGSSYKRKFTKRR